MNTGVESVVYYLLAGDGLSLALNSRMKQMEAVITSAPHSESGA